LNLGQAISFELPATHVYSPQDMYI